MIRTRNATRKHLQRLRHEQQVRHTVALQIDRTKPEKNYSRKMLVL